MDIKRVTIKNFQSHVHTVLEPAAGGHLTVVTGPSRNGKTAIFRALKWLFCNTPDGVEYIRWGETFCRVTAEYADGTEVIRYRTTGGVNRYIITRPGMDDEIFSGFGRGVPLEIQQITGVTPVEIAEGLMVDLNLADQLDVPFLGNRAVSSLQRAKILGKLAGTEELDIAGKQLATDILQWRRLSTTLEGQNTEQEAALAKLDYLPELKTLITEAQRLENESGTMAARRLDISEAKDGYWAAFQENYTYASRAFHEGVFIQSIAEATSQLDYIAAYANDLNHLITAFWDATKEQGAASVQILAAEKNLQIEEMALRVEKLAENREKFICAAKTYEDAAEELAVATKGKIAAERILSAGPLITKCLEAINRGGVLYGVHRAYQIEEQLSQHYRNEAKGDEREISDATTGYSKALEAAGQCPTCGQKIAKGGNAHAN